MTRPLFLLIFIIPVLDIEPDLRKWGTDRFGLVDWYYCYVGNAGFNV